jgi:hypothetical protein
LRRGRPVPEREKADFFHAGNLVISGLDCDPKGGRYVTVSSLLGARARILLFSMHSRFYPLIAGRAVKQLRNISGGNGFAEQVALSLCAAVGLEI